MKKESKFSNNFQKFRCHSELVQLLKTLSHYQYINNLIGLVIFGNMVLDKRK